MLHGITDDELRRLNDNPDYQKAITDITKGVDYILRFTTNTVNDWVESPDNASEVLTLTEKALKVQPEFGTLIAIRSDILTATLMTLMKEYDCYDKVINEGERIKILKHAVELFTTELKLIEKLHLKHYKSYSVWAYRIYLVRMISSLGLDSIDYRNKPSTLQWPELRDEFKDLMVAETVYCKGVLTRDSRNFHVWNYLCHIWDLELINSEPSERPAILKSKIEFAEYFLEQSYSNYSGWNVILQTIASEDLDPGYREAKWNQWNEILMNFLVVEPENQTAWTVMISRHQQLKKKMSDTKSEVSTSCFETNLSKIVTLMALMIEMIDEAFEAELASEIKAHICRFLIMLRPDLDDERLKILGLTHDEIIPKCIELDPEKAKLYKFLI